MGKLDVVIGIAIAKLAIDSNIVIAKEPSSDIGINVAIAKEPSLISILILLLQKTLRWY